MLTKTSTTKAERRARKVQARELMTQRKLPGRHVEPYDRCGLWWVDYAILCHRNALANLRRLIESDSEYVRKMSSKDFFRWKQSAKDTVGYLRMAHKGKTLPLP